MKSACAAVASYLLFFPADDTMLQNKDYYNTLPKVEDHYFTPRQVLISDLMTLVQSVGWLVKWFFIVTIEFYRRKLWST